jgi:hypothetical protein
MIKSHGPLNFSPYAIRCERQCMHPQDSAHISSISAFDEYLVRLKTNHTGSQFLTQIHNDLQTIRREVKDNIVLAQHTYKQQHDKTITRPPHKYVLGEKIWLFIPYIHKTKHHILTPQWVGPKYISRIHNNGTYHVRNCIDDMETGPINHRRLTIFRDPNLRPQEYITKRFPIIRENEEENHETEDNVIHNTLHPEIEHPPDNQSIDDVNIDTQLPEDQFIVERILNHKRRGKDMWYEIKWLGYKDTSWSKREDINEDLIIQYNLERSQKSKRGQKERQ